jgi:hypothetical protein
MKKEQNELENAEHDTETVPKKRIGCYGYDLDNDQWRRMAVDSEGRVKVSSG